MTQDNAQDLVDRFRKRDRGALARLVSRVENGHPVGLEALRQLYAETGRAHVIGITGPPGAGKSTLTNALIRDFRKLGKRVGVIAIDPSSSLTGGATLGDRIRMLDNYLDDDVYIRSMATRGEMGGLSLAVGGVTHVLDAFGFDVILVETVGVGQDEVDIAELADTVLLLQVPGLGDSVQTIKAGILEIGDVLVVNKADVKGAEQVVRDLRQMLILGEHGAWMPPIVRTIAVGDEDLHELIAAIDQHTAYLKDSGEGEKRRARRARSEAKRVAARLFSDKLNVAMEADTAGIVSDLERGDLDPYAAAAALAQASAEALLDPIASRRT